MLYLLDTADLDAIRHCNEFYPIDGVTTNPSILAKSGADFGPLLRAIRDIIGPDKMLHVQTRGETAEQIVAEARLLQEKLGGDFYLKIPICEEGLERCLRRKNHSGTVKCKKTAFAFRGRCFSGKRKYNSPLFTDNSIVICKIIVGAKGPL